MQSPTIEAPVDSRQASRLYGEHVNRQWVRLLDVLGMNAEYTRCEGTKLHTADGGIVRDFLSGYCVYNTGHNHPRIIEGLEDELRKNGPTMLQNHVPRLAAELAARLSGLAGGGLHKVFFTSSGSEGVETVIKFARAHTKRPGILYCDGAFHGLTCGALSLMGDPFWREGFGPLLPETESVPFLDLERLEEKLASRRFAAFVVEPIQSESGIRIPDASVLQEAQALCRRHGSLFVLDEVQTGICRTGEFLAAHHFGVEPDMVVLAKALSGGLVPVGAVLMTDAVCDSVYSSLERVFIHASTFGENSLAMRAAMETLDVLEDEDLGDGCKRLGDRMRERLESLVPKYEMVKCVRGVGLMNGIEFQPPRSIKLTLLYRSFRLAHAGLFGQMVVKKLFNQGILTQMCGNNYMVVKACPALVATEEDIDAYVAALDGVMASMHSGAGFGEGLKIAKRALVRR